MTLKQEQPGHKKEMLGLEKIVHDLSAKRRMVDVAADTLKVDKKTLRGNFDSFLRRYYGENGALIEEFLSSAQEDVKKQFLLHVNNGFLEEAFRLVQEESKQISNRPFNYWRKRVRGLGQ